MQITRHGDKRTRQRVGIPRQSVGRNVAAALEYGVSHDEATGHLRRYIAWLYNRYDGNGNNIRVYNDKVYVFHDAYLITVLNLPHEYHRMAMAQQQKKNRRNET